MAIVPTAWVHTREISDRVGRLQMEYAGNPLVKRIEYRIASDWSDDPALFIDVTLAKTETATPELLRLAENMRVDLLRLVRSDEIGLHSYLTFLS